MSDYPDIDWASQHIPQGRTVVRYGATRIPADAPPAMVVSAINQTTSALLDLHADLGALPARMLHVTYVTVPLAEVPAGIYDEGVYDAGYDRSDDVVVAIAHVPEDAFRGVSVVGRQEYVFPPVEWG